MRALRAAGAEIGHAFVIFHYGIFKSSLETLAAEGVRLHALATWWDVLKVARGQRYFDDKTLHEVESFLNDPMTWSAAHGGASTFPQS